MPTGITDVAVVSLPLGQREGLNEACAPPAFSGGALVSYFPIPLAGSSRLSSG
jgi:hypothetical protein